MIATLRQVRAFSRPVQVLCLNQVGINIGFYMLMPYLAAHLTGRLGVAAWAAGLILGVRNFSQQGLFLVGGTLADRIGYKPMIMLGCGLRTIGFAAFAVSESLVVLIAAAALTGFAGALFNPAARAYIAHQAGDQRVEAFSVFNVFYQLGILIGPLAGLALIAWDFTAVCLTAAAIFAGLTVLQARCLPSQAGAESGSVRPVLTDWREAVGNRPFMAFATAMLASYALSFQVYLGLPLEIERRTGRQNGIVAIFAVSAVLTLGLQIRLTAWCKGRWTAGRTIAHGLALMGLAFVPLALPYPAEHPHSTGVAALVPVMCTATLLTAGTMMVFPFEMAMISTLGGGRLVGTYYGLYNLLSGAGILVGNLATGAVLDLGRRLHMPALLWLSLLVIGLVSAAAVHRLDRGGALVSASSGGQVARPARATE